MPPRHRFLEPIHNVKEEPCGSKSAGNARETGIFIPGISALEREACVPGGAYRDRTDDLKLAKLALSQLS